jgi:hypothetical protein
MRIFTLAGLAPCFLVACGGSSGEEPPASPHCDYTEMSDGTNDMTAEDTGLDVGSKTGTLCGKVDIGHFAGDTIDRDTYHVTVGGTGNLLVEFGGDGVETIPDFTVRIFDTAAAPTLVATGTFDGSLGTHAAFLAQLPPADYHVVVSASGTADLAAAIPYKVHIVADDPDKRAPAITGAANYTEGHDNADSHGNDMVDVNFASDPSFTMASGSTPEPTGITIGEGKKTHITGQSAMVTGTDEYLDRDTYEIATDKVANELTIRLTWTPGTADLDFIVFEEGQLTPSVESNITGTDGQELQTFAVKPSTKYWVWVGAFQGSTGLPMMYDLSIYGSAYTP